MAAGTAWAGSAVGLWHMNLKINGPDRGFNFKLHFAEMNKAQAIVAANDIAGRYKYVIPQDSEIFFASLTKDDTKKDSLFLHTAVGPGLFNIGGVGPPDSTTDYERTSLLVRLENEDGGSVTRKINPLPDGVVSKGAIVTAYALTPIIGRPVAAPAAPSDAALWAANMQGLMGSILYYASHIKAAHSPGGVYQYFALTNAFPLRIGSKKGGRVFN